MSAADVVVHAIPLDDDDSFHDPHSDVDSTSTTATSPPTPPSNPHPAHLRNGTSSTSSLPPLKPTPPPTSFPYFVCLLYAFCVMGFDMALLGPSLLELAVQTNGTISSMSFVFFFRSGGLLTGTLVAGYLIDRWPARGNLLLCWGTGLMMAWTMVFPFIANVYALVLAGYVHGIIMGLIDNTSQVLLIRHFGDRVAPYMQALHFTFGLGSFISPLVLSPFLDASSTSTATTTVDGSAVEYDPTFHYAWIITALGGLPCTLWMMYWTKKFDFPPPPPSTAAGTNPALLPPPSSTDDGPIDDTPWHEAGQQQSLLDVAEARAEYRFQVRVVLTVGVFLTLYVGVETGYGGYLYSYAVTQLGASPDAAAYLNSGYWGFFALGRLAGVAVSLRFTAQQMVVSDLAGCMVAVLINLIWRTSFTALWVGTALYGFSVGSIYASAINYTERLVGVNGRLLSYLTFFAALGDAVVPFTIGSLFGTSVGPLGMQYVCLVVAAVATCVFAVLIGCVAGSSRGKQGKGKGGVDAENRSDDVSEDSRTGEQGEVDKEPSGGVELELGKRKRGKGYAELTADHEDADLDDLDGLGSDGDEDEGDEYDNDEQQHEPALR